MIPPFMWTLFVVSILIISFVLLNMGYSLIVKIVIAKLLDYHSYGTEVFLKVILLMMKFLSLVSWVYYFLLNLK